MEIEIPAWLYELLLIEAAKKDFAVEEIAESAFRFFCSSFHFSDCCSGGHGRTITNLMCG